MNIAFFGTPELCLPILEYLYENGYTPSVIITAPDKPVGRKQIMTPPPVKEWADEHTIDTLQPEKLDEGFESELEKYQVDVSIVVAYGKILPGSLIELPTYGTLNIHYSLLPHLRGASPVEHAILEGTATTGVTIQKMVEKMDAGPILAQEETKIQEEETTPQLRKRLTALGAELLVTTLPAYVTGEIEPTEQTDEATYCYKIKKQDGEVDLSSIDDEELWHRYRAFYDWPGIFFFTEDGTRVKITEASFKDGTFTIQNVIPAGEEEMSWEEFKKKYDYSK